MKLPFQSSFAARQVYIRMKPPPRNLAQSRAVYKALQKFGEISSFLNLKHVKIRSATPGRTAFAIFETRHAAESAIKASPFTISLKDPDAGPRSISPSQSSSMAHLKQFEAHRDEENATSDAYQEPQEPDSQATEKQKADHYDDADPDSISCIIQTTGYDHKATMRLNPYHLGFLLSRDWYEVHDLMDRQISPVPMAEYADCFTRRKRSMPYRVQDRILKENEEKGATSLMMLYKRGLERKKREEEQERKESNHQSSEGN